VLLLLPELLGRQRRLGAHGCARQRRGRGCVARCRCGRCCTRKDRLLCRTQCDEIRRAGLHTLLHLLDCIVYDCIHIPTPAQLLHLCKLLLPLLLLLLL
jgi:hypothetical protein